MRIEELFNFVHERQKIYLKKLRKEPKPWTKDKILQTYRFCNVYREQDTVTMWIRKNWRERYSRDPDLWFAMAVARLVNWPDSLQRIGYPIPWNPKKFIKVLDERRSLGLKAFTSAYMIHCGYSGISKATYLAKEVLDPMWEGREILRPQKGDQLVTFHQRLMGCQDMGSFMAAQVIADTKYHGILLKATDWDSWAASGPGSRRGLNRVMGYDVNSRWKEHEWLMNTQLVGTKLNVLAKANGIPRFHAQDVQSCFCEFDKYERVRLGEGRPKSFYPGV